MNNERQASKFEEADAGALLGSTSIDDGDGIQGPNRGMHMSDSFRTLGFFCFTSESVMMPNASETHSALLTEVPSGVRDVYAVDELLDRACSSLCIFLSKSTLSDHVRFAGIVAVSVGGRSALCRL